MDELCKTCKFWWKNQDEHTRAGLECYTDWSFVCTGYIPIKEVV